MEHAHLTIRLSRQIVHFAKHLKDETKVKEELEQENQQLE